MPTSRQETQYIASILDANLNVNALGNLSTEIKSRLTRDLAEKVGFITDNYSVRKSLFDLCIHYNPGWKIPSVLVQKLSLIWNSNPSNYISIPLHEFVGMDIEDFELYQSGKYYN